MSVEVTYINQVDKNVARILARENINITQGNYSTAAFNLKTRTMHLPIYKTGLSKNVKTLFVAHEISHALNTPLEGWHSSIKEEKSRGFGSYLNVVEDARIEKLIKRKYPGLAKQFTEGYIELIEMGFFGKVDPFNMMTKKFIDKLNFATKTGNYFGYAFNETEAAFYQRALNVETFEEARELAKEIYEYAKEVAKQEMNKSLPELEPEKNDEKTFEDFPEGSSSEEEEETSEEGETSEEESAEEGETSEEESTESESQDSEEGETPEESNVNETEEATKGETPEDAEENAGSGTPNEEPTEEELDEKVASETDEAFRENEESVNEGDSGAQRLLNEVTYENTVKDFSSVINDGAQSQEAYQNILREKSSYAAYKNEIKPIVNNLVRRFQMKQNASRMRKNKNVKVGAIDINKLHSYKTNDDIFLTNTINGKCKNHGMIIMLDWSGSIRDMLIDIVKKAMIKVSFCQKLNIPFEFYTYTTAGYDGRVLTKRFDSTMNAKKIDELMNYMFNYGEHKYGGWGFDPLGGTPLNQALVAVYKHVAEFKRKFSVDRVSLNVICDGDSTNERVLQYSYYSAKPNEFESIISGSVKRFDFSKHGRYFHPNTMVQQLLFKEFQDIGVDTNFFYLTFKGSKRAIENIVGKYVGGTNQNITSGFHFTDEKFGINKMFVFECGSNKEEELDNSMNKNEIVRTLKKNGKKAAVQKLFVNEFIESIA